MTEQPLVSVHMITYNHEKFISNAIEGVLIQKTTFPIELIISDDCSKDNTPNIIREFSEKYPNLIKPIFREINMGSINNFIDTFRYCTGKYIALCEGDDYWTDPYKLQKQVDFLEGNPEYIFTFHDAFILNQSTGEKKLRIGKRKIDENVGLLSLIIQNNIPTASLVFRNILKYNSLPDWFFRIKKGDYGLCVLLAEKGPGKYIPEPMSVYRIHNGGVWSGSSYDAVYRANKEFYRYLLGYFDNKEIQRAIKAKMQYVDFNHGISKIRNGHLFSGFFQALLNLRLWGDKRIRTNPRKIASAVKAWLRGKM